MDGEFACPQCGQTIHLRRPAPGRQARCRFCNSLVEAPFLPRVGGSWKRKRFGRPAWVRWASWGIGAAAAFLIAVALIQAAVRGERAARARLVQRLIDSSKAHEAEGRLDKALLDLDSALQVAHAGDAPAAARARRLDLARRDVDHVVERLSADDRAAQSMGDWLNLVARVGTDRDLAPVRKGVEARFADCLRRWIDSAADRATREPDASEALALCDAGADLVSHLPEADRPAALGRFRAIAACLADQRGVVLEAPPGEYVLGTSATYERDFRPAAYAALRCKGYLPPPAGPRWGDLWNNPPFRLIYAIRETHEGRYLDAQHRLTRIEARLTLVDRGREVWQTSPSVRTLVPVPNLPSYLAGRLALNQGRADEAEKILYDNALAQIRERFRLSLATLPTCPAGPCLRLGAG